MIHMQILKPKSIFRISQDLKSGWVLAGGGGGPLVQFLDR